MEPKALTLDNLQPGDKFRFLDLIPGLFMKAKGDLLPDSEVCWAADLTTGDVDTCAKNTKVVKA